jgi:hypothetical protein
MHAVRYITRLNNNWIDTSNAFAVSNHDSLPLQTSPESTTPKINFLGTGHTAASRKGKVGCPPLGMAERCREGGDGFAKNRCKVKDAKGFFTEDSVQAMGCRPQDRWIGLFGDNFCIFLCQYWFMMFLVFLSRELGPHGRILYSSWQGQIGLANSAGCFGSWACQDQ